MIDRIVLALFAAANEFNQKACGMADEAEKALLGCSTNKMLPEVATNFINIIIAVLGVVAVVTIIMGGQRYIVSSGDPGKITAAKNMIVYGVVGLIVAALAFAIVNFIMNIF